MNKYFVMALLGLFAIICIEWKQMHDTEEKWKIAEANVKAYSNQLGDSKNNVTALQLTVDQLKYFNDSVLKALDDTRKDLKIKDKNLKALQQVASSFSKKDTITIPGDTIFKDPEVELDTLIGDEWYTLQLGLKYPSMVAVKPYFKSEKHIIVSSKKETVNPPKKFFLFRWFQRKHLVLKINVVEKNPYVDNENSKYIEIIK